MKMSVVISLGTAVLMLVSTWSATASFDTGPTGKPTPQTASCHGPQPDRHQAPWTGKPPACRHRNPRPEVTRHIYDHGGYRPGNW